MLLGFFYSILASSLILLASGLLGTHWMQPAGTPRLQWHTATVASAAWPKLTLRSEAGEWTIRYWPLLPRYSPGQKVEIAVDPTGENPIFLQFEEYHPMNQVTLGFIVSILSTFALAITYSLRRPKVAADAMPTFPVQLASGWPGLGILFLAVACVPVVFVLYRWAIGMEDLPRFSWMDPVLLLGGGFFGYFGLYWYSLRVTVTETHLIDSSLVGTTRLNFSDVQSILLRPIRDQRSARRGRAPIVGWAIAFMSGSGKELYRIPGDLAPRTDYLKFKNYLFKRFPVEKAED